MGSVAIFCAYFLSLFFCIMFLIFAPHPLLYLCRLPDGDILVQKRYDTCNPILYELNYLRPFLGSPVLFYLWFCRPTFILAQEFILISKDLSSPLHSRGFIFTVTQSSTTVCCYCTKSLARRLTLST